MPPPKNCTSSRSTRAPIVALKSTGQRVSEVFFGNNQAGNSNPSRVPTNRTVLMSWNPRTKSLVADVKAGMLF